MGDDGNNKEFRELYSMFHQEYIIMAEYRMLQTENIPGIYVIPSYENSFLKCNLVRFVTSCQDNLTSYQCVSPGKLPETIEWFGVIFVRSGAYEGGIFRFSITLPDKFPNTEEVPIVSFNTPVYHPAIDATSGFLNMNEVFPEWNKKCHHIWQILKFISWIFHHLNFKVPINVEASVANKTNRKLFMEKVKDCVIASIDHIYDDPPIEDKHYIIFRPYDPDVHDSAKNLMLKTTKSTEGMSQGLSWVQPGSFQPFSKETT